MAKQKILVAEDDPLLLSYLTDFLEDETGYSCQLAQSGAEALAFLEEDAGSVALIFTDIKMAAEDDGLLLAKTARQRWPSIPILISSGRRPSQPVPHDILFIQKPWDPEQMRDLILRIISTNHEHEDGRLADAAMRPGSSRTRVLACPGINDGVNDTFGRPPAFRVLRRSAPRRNTCRPATRHPSNCPP